MSPAEGWLAGNSPAVRFVISYSLSPPCFCVTFDFLFFLVDFLSLHIAQDLVVVWLEYFLLCKLARGELLSFPDDKTVLRSYVSKHVRKGMIIGDAQIWLLPAIPSRLVKCNHQHLDLRTWVRYVCVYFVLIDFL